MTSQNDEDWSDEDGNLDILRSIQGKDDDHESEPVEEHSSNTVKSNEYISRKPRWWRQKSHRPSKAQKRAMQEMMEYQLIPPGYGQVLNWEQVFHKVPREIWLEIGFGDGDNLLRLAEQYPEYSFVGAEVHQPAVGKVMRRMQEGIAAGSYWSEYTLYSSSIDPFADGGETTSEAPTSSLPPTTSRPYSNLRIRRGDAIKLLPSLPVHSVSNILITNPDPFPKAQQQWRILQSTTVKALWKVLEQGGQLYLATDHAEFFQWSLDTIGAETTLFTRIDPCPDRSSWLPVVSCYEQRGWQGGRKTLLTCWKAL